MSRSALTIVLALLTMVGPLGIDAYLPSFHAIGASLGASQLAVQQTLSFYMAGMSIMMLFYGTLSDSFGRRPVMLVSLLLFTVTSVLAALATSIEMLVAVRVLQGLCGGAGLVIARAMVQDQFRGGDAQRMMAMITMVFGLAPALAPVLGGWLQAAFGWRAVFWFLALFGAGMWAVSRSVLRETLPLEQRTPFNLRSISANYLRSLRSPRFLLMAGGIAMVFSGLPLYVGSASAYVMNILHQPETAFGWLFIPMVAGLMAGSATASRLAHRIPPDRMIRAGFAVMGLGVASSLAYVSIFTPAVPYAVLPFMVYTFGLSLSSPSMMVMTLSVFPEMRGLAASMQGFMQMLLFAFISGLVAPLVFGTAPGLALTHVAGLAIGIALWEAGARFKAPPPVAAASAKP
ncbi:MAG: multidrug effflux MFS transporter [Pigmentiphaga sp.]|uniref:multidrug effflux MFS transporter n=1 Tax=Pigmentiphaga sp. TaxID=1977564 RepID=UPI0029B15ECD|nr:multidrug effflux MFS transporter [Pigmentiphaga sp.]MDX3904775.1 multidrug effflux MFS transporter [Pigmentiphaga sp.]